MTADYTLITGPVPTVEPTKAQLREAAAAILAAKARAYFDLADANRAPQTRDQFMWSCAMVRHARDELRRALEAWEEVAGG